MPSREYYLEGQCQDEGAPRRLSRLYRRPSRSSRGCPAAKRPPTASSRSRPPCRRRSGPPADRRDIDKIYNPMTRPSSRRLAPQFDWTATLAKAGLGRRKTIIVTEPSAVAGAGKILARHRCRPGRNGSRSASFGPCADASQGTRRRTLRLLLEGLNGVQQQRERWKRGVAAVNDALGEGVGRDLCRRPISRRTPSSR